MQNRTTAEAADEEGGHGDYLVIARGHATCDKQLRVRHELTPDRGKHDLNDLSSAREGERDLCPLTRRRELRVHALAHDTLQAHARTYEAQTRVRARVGPRQIIATRGDAILPTLPKRDRGRHGEERLDERAEEQPQSSLRADPVADAADEGAEQKCGQRGEGHFIPQLE